jgi:hypothetical protein
MKFLYRHVFHFASKTSIIDKMHETVLDRQTKAQLEVYKKSGGSNTANFAEPCELCGNLDQRVLENMKNRYYKHISAMEEKAEANCAGCRVLCWIASDFQARGNLKGPSWRYGQAVFSIQSNPAQFIVEARDPDNRFGDPRRNKEFQDKVYFEIFTSPGLLPSSLKPFTLDYQDVSG